MEKHVYTSASQSFLEWNEWVNEFGTIEDKLVHLEENHSPEKAELYERWLQDQKITSYTHMVDGEIVQTMTWNRD